MPVTKNQVDQFKEEEARKSRTPDAKMLDFLLQNRDKGYTWSELLPVMLDGRGGEDPFHDAGAGVVLVLAMLFRKDQSVAGELLRELKTLVDAGKVRVEQYRGNDYYFAN